MFAKIKKLLKDEEGPTAVEYGLLVAAIAAVIITVVLALGQKVNTAFKAVEEKMPSATPGP